jgi:TrmH family RNA methyltransferase
MRPLLQAVRSREELEIGGRPIATDLCGAATKPDFDVTALQQPTGGPIILLDHPRSLANVGAAIRIAAATAAAGVLTTGDQDPWHPVALRGSAGLHFAQPVGRVEIDDLTAERPIIGFDAGGQHFNPSELPPTAVLAFGSERHGISDALRERCSMIVALPMREGVSSLNLATSVAAVLMSWRVGTGWTGR